MDWATQDLVGVCVYEGQLTPKGVQLADRR